MILVRHFLLILMSAVAASNAYAFLQPGEEAPDFTAQLALGGKEFSLTLSEALKQGPVVLYFYPKAFTSGCTVEAHLFAEATEDFAALGATVFGVSHDTLEVLKDFSVKECRNKFAVVSDPDGQIIKAYAARLWFGSNMAKRVSYVITPDRKVFFLYNSMKPDEHVKQTLEAVKNWKTSQMKILPTPTEQVTP